VTKHKDGVFDREWDGRNIVCECGGHCYITIIKVSLVPSSQLFAAAEKEKRKSYKLAIPNNLCLGSLSSCQSVPKSTVQ